ncbi:hypothetical protein N7507_003717 [Penicillium longicatenatum]|nr:hypothetical protein N7507_003717 [Penicillium longicatenatum]
MDYFDEAIRASRQAVQATPEDHPDFAIFLDNLGTYLESRYERTGQIEDLEEAIRVSRQALQATPDDHCELAEWSNNLGNYLRHRYKQTGQIEDLEEAIRLSRQAAQATPEDHPDLAIYLDSLGTSLESRYERTGQIEDLEEAIRVTRQAVQATPEDNPDLAISLNNLGNHLGRRYERTGQMENLEEAIRASRQAIEDLEEAIRLSRQAAQATPEDHPDLAIYLNNLGNRLESRYERTGQIEDLEEAIRASRQAVQATPDDHTVLNMYLDNLGTHLACRYKRTGQIDDLEEAIWVSRQGVQATAEDHPDLPMYLDTLGHILGLRYERTGQIEDLEEAILVSRHAVENTPYNHPNLAGSLAGLGNKLGRRYERTGKIGDLREATRMSFQAVQITPNDDPDIAIQLNPLGIMLLHLYKQAGQIEILEEAILMFRHAVQATPDDHTNLATWLHNLGILLGLRYEQTGQMEDLEEAIRVSRQAVNSTPDDHLDRAISLYSLGSNLECRHKQTKQEEDLKEAILFSRQAIHTKSAPPLSRIMAALQAIRLLLKREDHHGGYALSVEAIGLLQLVHKRSLTLQDRQYVVSHFSGLATQACSLALQTGQSLFEGLRLLESGRGVILSLLMDDRSDTSKLREAYPALCEMYESIRLEVNRPVDSTPSKRMGDPFSRRRTKALEEFEKCIQDIRQLPGFDSFQHGLTVEEMVKASKEGNIIVVNVTGLRSDAIVISLDGYRLVPLPRLCAVQTQSWLDQDLTSASPSEHGVKNKAYRQFLGWLWRECVKPILTELGYCVQSSLDDLPRAWWIGTGLASSFPFHAARDDSAGPTENTLRRVLSSYTPSVKALLHARERIYEPPCSNERPLKLLMVTMANTPGADGLPGVTAQRSTVLGELGDSVRVAILDQPNSASVLRQIQECNIAHFACHGISNSRDPSQSGLLLQTAGPNPNQDILSVLKLCENLPTQAQIAYLSACSTAENRAERLMDEVLHVVSGFQVAGFRHVIGTLWPSDDSVCVEVARKFYNELCRNGAMYYNDRAVAMALHKAVSAISMSEDYRKRPLHWAQYVHYGA